MNEDSMPGYIRVLRKLLFPQFLFISATSFSQTGKGIVSFPAFTPNSYGRNIPAGTFIVKLTYQTSRISVNTANVNEARARPGADKF